MENRKSLKRSKDLVSLSREHHDGLLLCWKIRTGLKNSTSINRINDYISYFFNTRLAPHFATEEKYLFTLLPADIELRLKAVEQHEQLRSQAYTFLKVGAGGPAALEEFASLLEAHIRFEERRLFPFIEQNTNPQALTDAGKNIFEQSHSNDPQEEDDFWTKTG